VRKEHEPGVLAPGQKSASELAARDAFNCEHPRSRACSAPCGLHQIERHPVQVSPEETARLLAAQQAPGDQDK